jgi:ABC-type uncharacterized transport system fused permease/ATPase subunit
MAGFFVLLLLIVIVHYGYVAVGALVLWLVWCLLIGPWREREIQEARLRQRHEQARAQIDAVAAAATRAMIEATQERRR